MGGWKFHNAERMAQTIQGDHSNLVNCPALSMREDACPASSQTGSLMRVVLVDPSRTVLKFVARLLQARDHDVRPFTEGSAALDYIKSDTEVDALITSAELITMSGLE